MRPMLRECRQALRSLSQRPAFSLLAITILALGIGANTAIFSVVHGVLLAPLPYADAERLVQVWNTYPLMGLDEAGVSVPDYLDRQRVQAFESSALYRYTNFNLGAEGAPERVLGVRATASIFPLLKVLAAHGRVFGEAEDHPGEEQVVVISHSLWLRQFGGQPEAIDSTLDINGRPHRLLGVLPQGFTFINDQVQVWKPFAITAEQSLDEMRGNEFSAMLARLVSGATVEQAQQEVDAIHQANLERFPEIRSFWQSSGFGGWVVGLRDELYSDLRPTLLILQGVVAFVLLLACANVANLLLTRLAGRKKELAIRSAMGASRLDLARQLLIESLLLGLGGGLLGAGLGWVGVRLLHHLEGMPTDQLALGPNLTVLAFTAGLALATGLLFGLVPVWSLRRHDANSVIKAGGGRGASAGAAWPRRALVIAEVAIAMLLLVGAGLLVRSLMRLEGEHPGFDAQGVLVAQVSLPAATYSQPGQIARFFDNTLARLRTLPGVRAAGAISAAPFSGRSPSGSYSIEGFEPAEGESDPHALIRVVDDHYFDTLGIQLLRGRGFGSSEQADSQLVVVVDRRMVDKYWPHQEPLGKRLTRDDPNGENIRWLTVVGVVESVKIRDLERPVEKETIYASLRQLPNRSMTFALATGGDPLALARPLRDTVLANDPALPVYDIQPLSRQLSRSLRGRSSSMDLLMIFGALAIVLAAVGLYGVLSFTFGQRTRELGTRAALGASPSNIFRLVLGQGMLLTAIGVVLGGLAAIGLGRYLGTLLYEVRPWDTVSLVTAALLLLLTAALACLVPGWRAMRTDPATALRQD